MPIYKDMEETQLSAKNPASLSNLLKEIQAGAKRLGMYPPGHPAAEQAAAKAFELLQALLTDGQPVVFAYADGRLLGNGAPLDEKLLDTVIGRILHELNISSIAFTPEVTQKEFEKFLPILNSKIEELDFEKELEEAGCKSISIARVHYQLVGDDEKVVQAGAETGGGEGLAGALGLGDPSTAKNVENKLVDVIRNKPEMLIHLIVRGKGWGHGFGFGGGGKGHSGTSGGSGGVGTGKVAGGGHGSGGGDQPGEADTGGGHGAGGGAGTQGGSYSGSGPGGGTGSGNGGSEGESAGGSGNVGQGYGGSGQEGGGGDGDFGLGIGVRGGAGPGTMSQDEYDRFKDAFGEIDDEELLGLLVTALRLSLDDQKEVKRSEIGQTLLGFKDLLVDRNSPDLLPQLQERLESLGILDNEYLRELLAADASPKKIAHLEIESFKSHFFAGTPDMEEVEDLLGWLQTIGDQQYTEDFVKKFFEAIRSQGYELTDTQHDALLRFASLCADDTQMPVASKQISQIRDRLSEPGVELKEFEVLAAILERFYLRYIELDLFRDANDLLELIVQRVDDESVLFPEGIPEAAAKIHEQLTSAQLAESLVKKLSEKFTQVAKPMIPLLEKFNTLEAIMVFTGHLNNPQREVRIPIIRILSNFGERTIKAFKIALSDRTLLARRKGDPELPQKNWYKLRNLIFVLGNIRHPESVDIVCKFATDPDERVVLESLIALEKLGGSQSARVVARLLQHPLREIYLKALNGVSLIGTSAEYPFVEEYFIRHKSERKQALPVLIKLDKQRALSFLADVLIGESDAFKKVQGKADEDLNELIVKTLTLVRSVIFDDVLRKYVKRSTRSLFGQFKKAESVKMAERYLKTIART